MNLEELSFSVKTEQLKTAIDMVDSLAKALGNLHTVQAKETKTAIDAAKVKEAEAKAAKAVAEATIKETQAKEAGEKASKNKTKADKEITEEVDKQNKVLERNTLILNFMREGFSKGQSGQLAYAKMTGALTDELLSLEKVLLNQRKLMSGDPFDKSMSGMVALQNQYSELKEAVRQYNAGTELSRLQTRELSRDKERIIEKMKMEGKSFTDIKDAIRSYNKEYVDAANSVNSLVKVEKDIERAHRDSMNAVRNLTVEEQRMASVIETLNGQTSANTRLSEQAAIKIANYERNLRLAGVAGKEAADKLSLYRKQQEQILAVEQERQKQYLVRSLQPQATDVFVSLASGQNPLTVLLQQGGQINDLFTATGVKASESVKVMTEATVQMFNRLKDTAMAMGLAVGQAFLAPGRYATEFALKVTGINAVMDKYYAGLLDQGPPDRFTAGMIRMGSSAKSFLNILVGVGVAGIVGGLAMVLASIVSVIKQQDRLAVSMGQFGQSMGVSFQSAVLLTESLRSVNIGSAKATESLIAMAATGKFVATEFEMVTKAAVNMQKYTGIPIEETVKSFAKMKEKPVEALYELAQATGMVTSAQISWINELVRTDRQTEASAAAIQIQADVYAKQTTRMKENLSGFAIFMKELGSSISEFFDTAFKALWSKTDERAILLQKIEALKPSLDNKLLAAGAQADIAVFQEQLKMLDRARQGQDDLAASQKASLTAQKEFLDKVSKYEDKDKIKMTRAGSRSEYIKSEIENYKKLYTEMTKTEEELAKQMYGEKWDTAHKAKTGKTAGEKEADRIKKYYDRIIEGANNAKEETKGLAEGLNKYEIALNKIQNGDYFGKLSKTQQKNIQQLYNQAVAQEDINIVQKLYNNLLAQADGLGADYYERLKVIARASDAGFDPAIIEKLKKKLYEATEQGKQYVSFMNELIKKTEELAIARAKLEGERTATLIGGTEGEYLKEQLTYQEKLAKAQKDYNAEQAKVNEFYISKSKAPADEEKRLEAMGKLKAVYDSTVANISFEQQTVSLSKFTEQFSLLIQVVESLGSSLTNVFGDFGTKLGATLTSFANLAAGLDQSARQIEASMQAVALAKQKVVESSSYEELIKNTKKQADAENTLAKTQKKAATNELAMYANLAGAAKGMFNEKTAAAKAFSAIEKVLHVARIGMMLVENAEKIKSVVVTIATDGAKQASAIATATIDATAAVIKAIASAPPPWGFVLGAAVAGVVGGLLTSIGGSMKGGNNGSAPKYNEGTGTVFGDTSAKSESIQKSISLLEEANTLTQKYSPQMLVYLRNIDSSIGGLVNLLIRTGNVDIGTEGVSFGSKQNNMALSKIATAVLTGVFGFIIKPLGNLIGSIFGKTKVTNLGSGITGNKQTLEDILGSGFDASYFTDVKIKKSGWFGGSTKYKTYLTNADAELEQQITKVFEGVYNSVFLGAKSLGMAEADIVNTLNSFVVDIGKVKLSGTAEEMQATLNAVFGAASDNIAKAVMPGLEAFQKVGEGYFETLMRVASELENVNSWFDMLGVSLLKLGVEGVSANEALISLFGGISNFETATSNFYDKFYSDEEKNTKRLEQLGEVFGRFGINIPDTIESYKKLVQGIDVSTAYGQNLYYTLIGVSDAFYEVIQYANDATEAIKQSYQDRQAATDEAYATLKRSIEAEKSLLTEQQTTVKTTISNLTSIFDTLAGYVKELRGTVGSSISVSQARSVFTNAVSTGVVPEKDVITQAYSVVKAALDATKYSSKVAKDTAYLVFSNEVENLKNLTGTQLTTAEQTLVGIESQITLLTDQLALAEKQFNALRDINDSVLQVAVATQGFVAALEYERQAKLLVPAFADGGSYQGGLALVGEKGPEVINFNKPGQVYTANQTAGMFQGDNSSGVVDAVNLLNENLSLLRAEVRADVSHNAKTAKLLDRVIPDGQTVQVSVVV